MKIMKILSTILVLAMLCGVTQSMITVSAATITAGQDGVVWLEETDYDSGITNGMGVVSGKNPTLASEMSGGNAHYAYWGGVGYSATYKLNVTTGGTYKLWYRGSDPTNAYHDKSKILVNGTEVSLTKVDNTSFTATVETEKNYSVAWFVGEATLVSGENEVVYDSNAIATSGGKYSCFLDCIVLAPSSYEWERPSISTRPTGTIAKVIDFDSDGVAKIEETDYDSYNQDGFGQLSKKTLSNITLNDLSGGDASYAWWGGTQYFATYKLNALDAGTYKIWFRGSDPANEYYDKAELRVNETKVTLTKVDNTAFQATVDGKNFSCAWFVGEVTLNAGVNEITYITNGKSSNGSKYACLFDCVVVAPSDYEWERPSIQTKPEAGIPSNVIEFNGEGIAKFEETDYDTYNADGFGIVSGKNASLAAEMSGGNASYAWWGGVEYSATYKLNVTDAGTYKIWYRGSDPAGSYHDKSKLFVNGTEVALTKVENTSSQVTLEAGKNFAIAWLVGEIELETGVNEIAYNVNAVATDGGKYACLFDCMVVAPATYVWEEPTIDSYPAEEGAEPEKFIISTFAIDGTVTSGQTVTASASVKRGDGENGNVNLILAVYTEDNEMVGFDICKNAVANEVVDFDCSITISEEQTGSLYAKAFLWTDFSELAPITSGISTLD